jgi:heme exporter protein C
MKGLIIALSVTLSFVLGFFPSINKSKPLWWKLLTITTITTAIVLTLLPPIAGNFADLKFVAGMEQGKHINLLVKYETNSQGLDVFTDDYGDSHFIENTESFNLERGNKYIINSRFENEEYIAVELVSANPFMTYPFIPSLEDRTKILNFHVPMAWISVLAYLISMIYAVQYLRTKDLKYDTPLVASASLGTLFAILATVTGMLWAKFNWGSFWNWDPRQTSILILLLIYGAFFALRSSIDVAESKARLSSVYAILAFITVPFLVFILPRMATGLHPGSADDSSTGPLVSSQSGMLDSNMLISFGLAMFGFSMFFFWLLNLQIRIMKYRGDK